MEDSLELLNRRVIDISATHNALVGMSSGLLLGRRRGLFDQTDHAWQLLCGKRPSMTVPYNICHLQRCVVQGLHGGVRALMSMSIYGLGLIARARSQSHHLTLVLAWTD